MNPLSSAVEAHLSTASPDRARSLRAWFSAFPTDVQDIVLERAKRTGAHAVVFRDETHHLGKIAA